ncbi:GntR family transcriptional regulator [Actinomyces oris]|uniref:GntR family transcriptional regulator n=1 Tax=Actinomyces oris TaxID=544580 RepID=UPI0009D782C9|nr:GntR family transcriptional regulator [Actinomyces oris]
MPAGEIGEEQIQPRYQEIGEWLAEECSRLPAGTLLPSESQLATKFNVSRMTARHALEKLRESGKIERRRGVGSFVADPQLHRREAVLRSFTEEIAARGMVASSIVLDMSLVVRPSEARELGLDPKSTLIAIDRIRCADGVPVARERVHLSEEKYRAVLDRDLSAGSLHAALLDLGATLSQTRGVVTARLATSEECNLLQVEAPAALLVETRTVSDSNGVPVENTETAYLGTRWAIDTLGAVTPR